MAKLKKPNFSSNRPGNKSRKQLRKEKRLGKKERKNEHYKKKFLISNLPQKNETTDSKMQTSTKTIKKKLRKQKTQQPEKDCDERSPVKLDTQALQKLNHANEINLKRKLEKDMKKQRKIQLLEENKYEDKEIKKLEKQLKMNKRKSKTLPKCFIEEGLDYILNVCDSDGVKNILDNQESDSEFVDDLAMVKGEKPAKRAKTSSTTKTPCEDTDSDEEMSDDFDDDDDDDGPHSEDDGGVDNSDEGDVCDDDDDDEYDDDDQEEEEDEPQRLKNTKSPKNVAVKSQAEDEDLSCVVDKSEMDMNEDFDDEGDLDAAEGDCDARAEQKHKSNGEGKYWQDIYGRQRDEKGNIVQTEGKYIPPHLKAKMLGESSERKERLSRLSRQLKGHINRLAENNMHRIVTEMDQLYMQNSRNDMNETLTKLIFESLIQPFLIPERLISEHTMLIAALHANVGTEVGAFFLQDLIEKFDETLKKGLDEDKKDLDNILLVISYLYIYKVCHSVLIYDILDRICRRNSLGEKEVELLLVVLRSAGFCLRKDDPLALKNLIMKIETQASSVANNSRVKFMLSVLRAIKNNNTTKVPQYDANRYDHLRKILKTVVQKGKYISELKISLEDLLNAESRGRWWIVGSAWARDSKDDKEDREAAASSAATAATTTTTSFTSKLLDLAKKQRMNTDARRNIFCILMSAEDYLDAFEKLLKLGLKGHQEQEIFNVIMHCSIQEKTYNPYYAYLVARLCTCNRKFVMMFQYHLWDRFKELKDLKRFQITNMAKLLAHLLLQNLLPLSALKVIEFASLERPSVRLLRQLFLTVLLSDNEEEIATVFSRISQPPKLHIFRESIRLFLHQFLLKHQPDSVLLKNRIQMAESLLMGININENLNSKMF